DLFYKNRVVTLNRNQLISFTGMACSLLPEFALKNDKKFSIVDLRDFSVALRVITNFFDKSNFDSKLIVSYMENILETYKNNDYDAKIRW
ncbi:hypothetical protein EV143_103513, partial [Flavobacterium chryseum]|uniref:hypothetical protein n=1 Tax=Flavobacterium sp. P3160 TaxID=2512113 RepID=UPI0010E6F5F3